MSDIKFQATANYSSENIQNYTNSICGTIVYGYYVKSRGRDYILQEWNESGYDERWEASKWVQVFPESVNPFKEDE